MQTCLPFALLTLSRIGVLSSAFYLVCHTLPRKALRWTPNHLFRPIAFCPFRMHNDKCTSSRLCILISLLIHVISTFRSTCNIYHSHVKMLATKAYRTTPSSWTIGVPALKHSGKRNTNVWRTAPSSTVSVTALLPSTQTAFSLSIPPVLRTSFDFQRRQLTRLLTPSFSGATILSRGTAASADRIFTLGP